MNSVNARYHYLIYRASYCHHRYLLEVSSDSPVRLLLLSLSLVLLSGCGLFHCTTLRAASFTEAFFTARREPDEAS